ncbi:hypothetical protein BH10ACT11_BH10ACT11_02700 [soil metagenome]
MDTFLKNLYRDLQDRHLLLPVLALVVALVAAPKILAKDADTPPPPPAPATQSDTSEISSAVLADNQVSVRDYRKRLDELKSKNPFKQQLTASAGGDTGTTGTSGATGASGATDPGTTDPGTTTPTSPVTPPVTGTTGPTGPDNGNGGNGTHGGNANNPDGPDVKVVNHLYTRRVDLLIGPEGNPKLKENVQPMTTLPDNANPLAAYLGTDEKGKRAAFVISKDVTLIGGDGACVPSPESCLFITLEKGETSTLTVGDPDTDGQTYELRLVNIHKHRVPAE